MHDTRVKMKDGRMYCGPIYMWRPSEGWFSIPSDDTPGSEKILLDEVESAVTAGQRVSVDKIEDQNVLERARREGWDARHCVCGNDV